MAISKLNAFIRKTAARTITALWAVIADAIFLIKPEECANYSTAYGFDCD